MSRAESLGPHALGGGPLDGNEWVRVLYMDESGVGNIKSDPFLVVAGVIIHADTQWGDLANRLDRLLTVFTPVGAQKPKHLHAKDIYHGSGEFPRQVWNQVLRNRLLEEIGSLIHEYQIPVVWIGVDRKKHALDYPSDSFAEQLRDAYSVAAVGCFMQAELYMRQANNSAEVCSIVMEQNHELQKRIPEMVAFMRDPGEEEKNLLDGWRRVMPLTKLIDTPACQPKTASSILQLADYCAFALKRRLQGAAGSKRLTGVFSPQMVRYERLRGDRESIWNPVHLPSEWPYPVTYDDWNAKFFRADDPETK